MKSEVLQVKSNGSPQGNAFLSAWIEAEKQSDTLKIKWINDLRSENIKAAHPDDGWVDRKANTVVFAYPQFYDDVGVGSLIALGWHFDATSRIVRLISSRSSFCSELVYWKFEFVRVRKVS